MKSKIAKLLLMSRVGGKSYTVLTELLEKYKECGGEEILFIRLFQLGFSPFIYLFISVLFSCSLF
jgi:hypothetical protein